MFKKVLLTQLAIPDFDPVGYRSNAHLAPGYLVGYATPRFPNTEFVISPRVYTDSLSDAAFVEYAVGTGADLFVFTLYMWNIERSLRLSGRIAAALPQATFLFGGPEVTADNPTLLDSPHFTAGIVGEGEEPFCLFLAKPNATDIPGWLTPSSFNPATCVRQAYASNENPYLGNLIETRPDTTLFVETVRGCPFHCYFCYYNKLYPKVVPVGRALLPAIFAHARTHHFDELFLLDPSFNVQPKFDELLDMLVALNPKAPGHKQLRICTEVRADYLTDVQIKKLKAANVVEVEIGLQSTNPAALSAMGKKDRTQETIENTQKLLANQITCKVDLIAGLPGDTLASFVESVDAVSQCGIGECAQVFRLSVLPGTTFRKEKANLGIQHLKLPPYDIVATPTFLAKEIGQAMTYAEARLDGSSYTVTPYFLSTNVDELESVYPASQFAVFDSSIEPIHKLLLAPSALSSEFASHAVETNQRKLCETLVVHFVVDNPKCQQSGVLAVLSWLKKVAPYNYYQTILDFRCSPDMDLVAAVVRAKPRAPMGYLNRDAVANLGVDLCLDSTFAVIAPIPFMDTVAYAELKEQCDLFVHMTTFDCALLEANYDDHNFFFSNGAQLQAFEYLQQNERLDDFTLFDSYSFELQKNTAPKRMYRPNILRYLPYGA